MASQTSKLDDAVEQATPVTLLIDEELQNAAACAVAVEKRSIDQMGEHEREVHTFDQAEIREIERDVREQLAETRKLEAEGIHLEHDHLRAIYGGLVTIRLDNPDAFTSKYRRLMAEVEELLHN